MAAKRNLEWYWGPLTAAEAAEGINGALANAKRLSADAQTLFELERYPSALHLALLAVEEAGKCQHIRGIFVNPADDKQRVRHWRAFRRHTAKNGLWALLSVATRRPMPRFQDVAWLADADADHTLLAEDVKQASTYVDRYMGGDGRWSNPDDVVDKALADTFVTTARVLASGRSTSARSLELWEEHLGPAIRDGGNVFEGARRWNAALAEEGLEGFDAAGWERFLGLPSNDT